MSTQKKITVVTTAGPLVAAAENGFLFEDNSLTSSWRSFRPFFRLLLSGTGTCTLDSADVDGFISYAVQTFTVTDSTGQIEYPYPGDDAVSIRATLTGTCSVEIV